MLNELTITQAHQGLIKKEFSCQELTRACLGQIKKVDQKIKAFLTLTQDSALKEAKKIDQKIKNKEEITILSGIPVAIKDNINIEGVKTTAGSQILKNFIAPYDATVIEKLKSIGAIFLGKTNLDEFAMGSSTENSSYQKTANPCDLKRVPGGSSGGSAAAVVAHQCIYALGSDTGGSIRQPASFCGLVGLKPTYGRVSRYGLLAMASSLDQIGSLTKTVEDAALVLETIAGQDARDATSLPKDVPSYSQQLKKDIKGLKVGLPKEYFAQGLNREIKKIIEKAVKQVEDLGAQVREVELPYTKAALPVYYLLMPAEVSSNLARYDGIKYGLSDKKAKDLLSVYLNSRQLGFGQEAKRRIILGAYILSAGYYDAYYLKAQKVRTLIKWDFDKVFNEVDVLITPTSPTVAFKIGEKINDPLKMYLSDIYTVSVNLAGLPAISIPVGFSQGLPVGLQIIGRQLDEATILRVAYWCEQKTGRHN
ncbi:MAG: Asp-tRNA(Asn)/Glu-tRNA(Gln) amidotransferase subunit GatA [bacterium]